MGAIEPKKFPSLKTLEISVMTPFVEYRPAFECENIEFLTLGLPYLDRDALGNVIRHHTKDEDEKMRNHTLQQVDIKGTGRNMWGSNDDGCLETIITSITDVKIIGISIYREFLSSKGFTNSLVNMFKSCPTQTDTKLEKVITYEIPENQCKNLCEEEFSKQGWKFSVGQVDFAMGVADVTFTRITK